MGWKTRFTNNNTQTRVRARKQPSNSTSLCIYMHFFPVALRPKAGQDLFILEVSRSHTTTHHSRWDSSGRVIGSSQRPLPDNTQHSQQTYIHAPGGGFEPSIPPGERSNTHALGRAATGTGHLYIYIYIYIYIFVHICVCVCIHTYIR